MVKVFKWFSDLLLIIVIAVLFGYLLLRVTNKIEIYNVKTGSMEAKIHVGDYILIFKKNKYNVGDVVTYTSSNGFITHRIIKIDGNKVTTKGDANNTEDDVINAKIIVGKVIMSGGLLNILIKYKFFLSGLVLSLYLFSCYFESVKKEELELINDEADDLDNGNENSIESEEIDTEEILDNDIKEEKKEDKKNSKDELIDLIDKIKEEQKIDDKKSKSKRKIEKL